MTTQEYNAAVAKGKAASAASTLPMGPYAKPSMTTPAVAPQSTPVATLATRYASAPTPTETPLEKAQSELARQLKPSSAVPDQDTIYDAVRKRMQAQIDATNTYYNGLVTGEKAAGDVRAAQTRGLNVRSGLTGSDFASAAADETAKKNQASINSIESERTAKVSALLSEIDQEAQKEYAAKKAESLGNAKAYVDFLKTAQDSAIEKLTSIAKSGLKFDRVKLEKTSTGESVYDYIKRTSGMSDLELEALYNQNLPKPAKKDIHYENLGNGKIAAFYVDDNGQLVKNEYNFSVPGNKKFQMVDGVPYFVDETNGSMTPAAGFKGDTSGQTSYKTETGKRIIDSVDSLAQVAKDHPGIFGTTATLPIPDMLRTDAFRNFKAQLDTLKSNIAFGALTDMRDASKTGGALGQVSDAEERLLSSTLGSLDMAQSPEQFTAQLQKIRASVQRWNDALQKYGGDSSSAQTMRVRLKDGQTGTINASEFDPSTMTKIE